MGLLKNICFRFKLNPIIFKRFFSRKKANNKNDLLLTLAFILLIALTTALVFRSSCEIYKYDKEIEEFLSNEWNKFFYLYLQNCLDFSAKDISEINKDDISPTVINYLDSLALDPEISTNKGVSFYPEIVTIKSENSLLPKVQCYKFNQNYNYITKHLIKEYEDSLISEKPYIFLQEKLVKKLKVDEDGVVFIKQAGYGNSYSMPLQVKSIKDKSRIKCFVFHDYLFPINPHKKIRFYFSDFSELMDFLLKDLLFKLDLTKCFPIFWGVGDDALGYIYDSDKIPNNSIDTFIEKKYDFIYAPDFIASNLKMEFSDSLAIIFNKQGNKYIYKKNIDTDAYLMLDKKNLFNDFLHLKHGFTTLDSVKIKAIAFEHNPEQKLFVEFDFSKNFREGNHILKRQETLFEIFGNNSDYSIYFYTKRKLDKHNNYRFFYYDKFRNEFLTKDILNKFDEFNIRWDSGRWKTIIDLNNSLKTGKRNIVLLLIVDIIIFLLFLVIKLYLRLKLEFHTIGTIRCFGFGKKGLNKVYRFGYMIQILIGFILGLLIGAIISLFSGFNLILIVESLGFIFSSYLLSYLIVLILSSYFIIGYILNKLVHVDDIYGLIKYES